jgi:hypothetical protein
LQPLGGSVGIGTTQPHYNAVLDLQGINKGLLIPRGGVNTRANLNSNTAKGLIMYDTITSTLWIHNGNGLASGWQNVANGANHWTLSGALGTEIANTNSGGIWSSNESTVLGDPGPTLPPASGAGTRMMWLPQKSAFRVGTAEGAQWDASNIGVWSFATGISTIASGQTSTALGNSTKASAISSTALGQFTMASGVASLATGSFSTASGPSSTALGVQNAARSHYSTALGNNNIAKGFSSTVIGMYNDSLLTTNEPFVFSTTPLFIIGNGDGPTAGQRSNAMVVRKDGRVGIGTNTPATRLTVIGLAGNPSIPDMTSTGILRIGLNASEGIDIGKMDVTPFAGWIQAGIEGEVADPLSLQPSGGKVGIGTNNPANTLSVTGNTNITGNLGIGIASPANKLSVVGNANITGSVGIGTTSPAASAAMEISSTTKGFLPPRMTLANRNSMGTPVAGLMIWCSNCGIHGQLQIYNGDYWINMNGTPALGLPAVGDIDGGGIVAYILQPGDPGYVAGEVHGLIAAPSDHAIEAEWGCSGTNIMGAEGTDLGTGNQNTIDIIAGCPTVGIAARVCGELVLGGYMDWYLPSKNELNKLYLNKALIGGFDSIYYTSSSEVNSIDRWVTEFLNGVPFIDGKIYLNSFRPVRSF